MRSKIYDYFGSPNWSFREHLSRARPSLMIFRLLRSLRSECLSDYSPELMLDMLEDIIKWLQVSVKWMQPDKPLRLKSGFLSRDLVPSDWSTFTSDRMTCSNRATCTIASRVNFFNTKKFPSSWTLKFEIWAYHLLQLLQTSVVIDTPKHFWTKNTRFLVKLGYRFLKKAGACGIIVLRWSRSPMVTAGRNHSDIIFIFISHMVTRLLSTLV